MQRCTGTWIFFLNKAFEELCSGIVKVFGVPGRLRQPSFHAPLYSMDEPNAPSSKRAIVVGAGVAGLEAAKVLGDFGGSRSEQRADNRLKD